LKVEFVGHPAADRFNVERSTLNVQRSTPTNLLLPGSRVGELRQHLPVMLRAMKYLEGQTQASFCVVLAHESLARELEWAFENAFGIFVNRNERSTVEEVRALAARYVPSLKVQLGGISEALQRATIAIASTGTVTMECAFFGVPTIALYKTSWSTYQIGKRIIQVKYLAMPNLLANEAIFPELIQQDATAENIARAALDLLSDAPRREAIRTKLTKVVASLGGPGASQRAAQAIARLI
jgi:lipid-A-disaccharide synthase